MVHMVNYNSLSIHNKINAKTGWDIASAYEGQAYGGYSHYTRLAVLCDRGVHPNFVGNIYRCYR